MPLPFVVLGYDRIALSLFSISLLLMWSDAFLTYCALNIEAKEINPLLLALNKLVGRKRGLFASRLFGSALSLYGIVREDQYFLLVISWIFAIVICTNSVSLFFHFRKKVDSQNTDNTNDKQPYWCRNVCSKSIINYPNNSNQYRCYEDCKNNVGYIEIIQLEGTPYPFS